jgi:hypothetical protein
MATWRLLLVLLAFLALGNAKEKLSCSADTELDPALKEMTYDVGNGTQTVLVYVQPNVTSFYRGKAVSSTAVTPKHNGFAGKFINLSNKKLTLFW